MRSLGSVSFSGYSKDKTTMYVIREHRALTEFYDEETYYKFANTACMQLRSFSWASSCMLIGSCAKNTVVPGWSDIDILLFIEEDIKYEYLSAVKSMLNGMAGAPKIGITIDQISIKDLISSNRIGSQPLGMAIEVSQYGILKFGDDPFRRMDAKRKSDSEIKSDAKQYILADIFSWKRKYLYSDIYDVEFIEYTCKTYLRSLMRFSAPMRVGPFTYENRLSILKQSNTSHVLQKSMEMSVNFRSKYGDIVRDIDVLYALSRFLTENIDCLNELL